MTIDRITLRRSWRSWLSNDLDVAGPAWLQWLWTLLFCVALAIVFTLLGFIGYASSRKSLGSPAAWLYWFGKNFIVCLTIGVVIHLLFMATRRWAQRQRTQAWQPWQRTLYFSGMPVLGVIIGWPIGMLLAGGRSLLRLDLPNSGSIIATTVAFSLLIGFVLHHFFAAKAREIEADKRATEAQLRLLQAQMEPHFLFNTLANVQGLVDQDPAKAKQMLEAFTDYLRATLVQLRSADSTVGAELDLAETYLQLMQMRMEDRLRFRIEADASVRALPMPPLSLQPLVENALRHGLEPNIHGGDVTVRAHRDEAVLTLEVIDNGRGVDASPRGTGAPAHGGHGMALDNLRLRLQARFGDNASVALSPANPGTRALITVPIA